MCLVDIYCFCFPRIFSSKFCCITLAFISSPLLYIFSPLLLLVTLPITQFYLLWTQQETWGKHINASPYTQYWSKEWASDPSRQIKGPLFLLGSLTIGCGHRSIGIYLSPITYGETQDNKDNRHTEGQTTTEKQKWALLPFKCHNSVGFLKLASPLYFRGHPYKKIISAILLGLV